MNTIHIHANWLKGAVESIITNLQVPHHIH